MLRSSRSLPKNSLIIYFKIKNCSNRSISTLARLDFSKNKKKKKQRSETARKWRHKTSNQGEGEKKNKKHRNSYKHFSVDRASPGIFSRPFASFNPLFEAAPHPSAYRYSSGVISPRPLFNFVRRISSLSSSLHYPSKVSGHLVHPFPVKIRNNYSPFLRPSFSTFRARGEETWRKIGKCDVNTGRNFLGEKYRRAFWPTAYTPPQFSRA